MSNEKVMNRWLVVVGAILIQLCLGAIYAWSVFTPGLKDAGWSSAETQAVFAAGLASFAVVMVIAGRLMPKIGPRNLAIAGANAPTPGKINLVDFRISFGSLVILLSNPTFLHMFLIEPIFPMSKFTIVIIYIIKFFSILFLSFYWIIISRQFSQSYQNF